METKSPDPAQASDTLRVLKSAAVTVFAQDRDLKYRWIRNPPSAWRCDDIAGMDDAHVLSPAAAAVSASLKRDVLSTGRAQWGDIVVEGGASSSYFDIFVEAERDEVGEIVGIFGLAIDVTDRRKQAATLEAIGRDLSHRSKNLLAIIQSLATHTARAASSPEIFVEQFRGRIQSISRSQDLSIGAKRRGAALSELVDSQVTPYVIDAAARVAFKGVDCHLSPNAALHVGLALYELCIDSVRFGSLSAEAGRVLVTAELIARTDQSARPLRMAWNESGGPAGVAIEGFGRILLERVVPASVGGKATLTEQGSTRHYELTISGSEFWEA